MQRHDILIEADELLQRIDDPNLRIFDATISFFELEPEKTAHDVYLEGHLPNAAFFDHDKVSVSDSKYRYMILPEADLAARIGELGIGNDNEVIVYTDGLFACATRAWWVLRYAGHNNVRILNGGIKAWQAAGGELATGGNTYEPTTFEANLRPEMFATKEDVQAAIDDDSVNLEYTLPVESYGNVYIPSSSFLQSSEFTAGSSMVNAPTLKVDDDLREKLTLDDQYERTITYCGGGIAATVNGVAHILAGNPNVAVYDGSLGEWMGEGLPTEKVEEAT